MKKNYNLGLLSGGVALILALIASFVLQDFFGHAYLTLSYGFDTFVLLAVAFIVILQFKSFDKIAAIILVIYGALNILYGINGSVAVSSIVSSVEIEVIFILGLLLAHTLFEIAILFVLLHVTQPKFDLVFTKKFVIISLIISLVLLIGITPFVTHANIPSVIRMVFAVISIGVLYFVVQQMVVEKEPEEALVAHPQNHNKSKKDELTRLYERGIITQAEYDARVSKLEEL